MFKINLGHNKGFEWNKSENVYSKGYLFDEKDNLYQGQDLNIYFTCKSEDDFRNKVKLTNGSFAVITENKNILLVAVDRLRSIPLFYSLKDNIFYLSDNAYWIKNELDLKELDKISEQEFLLTGYVTDRDTLFAEIKQVQAGECLIVEEKNCQICIKPYRYYQYLHNNFFTESKEELFDKLDKVSENIFKRLINSVNGRTIVIPLSGGYDSRYIAAMLRKLNYKNVICFSYGKKGNGESKLSKKVAKNLGYKWYFIEYTKNKWRAQFNSNEGEKYLEYGNNLTSLAHLQDWPAVWELKKENKIPNDAVFVPGHSGDLLGGSWTPKPLDISKNDYKMSNVSEYLFKKHYYLFNLKDKCKKDLFLKKILKELNELEISDAESFVSLCECWNVENRQAKFIVNSVRVYEFFGYKWYIPLWDSELIDFWARVPLKFRIDKELYDDYLFGRLFSFFGVDYKKISSKNAKYFLKKIIKNNIFLLKAATSVNTYFIDYFSHPMSWYGIVNYYKYLNIMALGGHNINSLLVKITLRELKNILREKTKDIK